MIPSIHTIINYKQSYNIFKTASTKTNNFWKYCNELSLWPYLITQIKFNNQNQNGVPHFMPPTQKSLYEKIKSSAISWTFIASSVTFANPLDLVRFRMQVMPQLIERNVIQQKYKGLWNCFIRIKKQEGVKAFWKGNLSNLIRLLPSQTLIFTIKQILQKSFHYRHQFTPQQHFLTNSAIGIGSASIVSITLYPFEYVRQKLSNRVNNNSGIGIWQQLKRTVRNDGILGVYRGAHIFLLGLFLFRGTFFGMYDSLKVKTKDAFTRWCLAYLSMVVAITVTYPGDTIRRRIVSSKGKYTGMINCFQTIYKKQGVKAIFLGWNMVWLQGLTGSIYFYFYDKLFTDYSAANSN